MTAPRSPKWMSVVLVLAGAYNLAWGAWAGLFPAASFAHSGIQRCGEPLNYPQLWQGMGMLIGLFGVAYLLAALDTVRHWPVVLVGLLAKLFGGVGVAFAVATEQVTPTALVMSIPNDVIWWVPFALILRHAYRANRSVSPSTPSAA